MPLGQIRRVTYSAMLTILSLFCTACQTYFQPTPRVDKDMSIMNDLHRFELVQTATSDAQWIVAQITLAPGSHIPTMKTLPDGHARMTLTVSGTCKVLDPLGAALDTPEWNFAYETPYITAVMIRLPFTLSDGVYILRWNSSRNNEGMFPDGFRLPDATWAPQVARAWQVAREQPALFDRASAKKNVEALGDMTERGNPLLTMAAFRTLAKAGVIAPSWGDFFIMNSQFPTQGVIMRDYLQTLDESKAQEVAARFDSYLSNHRTVEEIEGIALAAYETRSPPAGPGGARVARGLRSAIAWRLPFLPGDQELRKGLIGLSHRWAFNN